MKYRIKITDEEKKEINISEDEIVEVKYNIGMAENHDYANGRSIAEMEIYGKLISNLENTDGNAEKNNDLYEKNRKNIIDLVDWAEKYMEKTDYRDIEIFIDLGSGKNIEYRFRNMFVYRLSQELSIERGIGIFKLKLRQKFHQKDKIEVK